MNIAIIPARGGSKRIPNKNIKRFNGEPIISYSIKAAKNSNLFSSIIVSTDDNNIASIARDYGAETPFTRPLALSGDHTSFSDVIKHSINWYQDNSGQAKYICALYATAPLIDVKDLINSYEIMKEKSYDFCLSVSEFESPIMRALTINEKGSLCPLFSENVQKRSQDTLSAFYDAGQFCWGTPDSFLNHSNALLANTKPYIIPKYRTQDIDTEDDWLRAELMFHTYQTTQMKR